MTVQNNHYEDASFRNQPTFHLSHPFPFQVGVVMLSILCHVWKVVPDLYEAIISMNSGDSECQEEVRQERHLLSSVVTYSFVSIPASSASYMSTYLDLNSPSL